MRAQCITEFFPVVDTHVYRYAQRVRSEFFAAPILGPELSFLTDTPEEPLHSH